MSGSPASPSEAMTTLIEHEPSATDLRAATELLVHAFDDDPFYVWLEPRASSRAALSCALLSFAMSGGTVRVAKAGDHVLGVIVFHDPTLPASAAPRSLSAVASAVLAHPVRTIAAGAVYASVLARRAKGAMGIELFAVDEGAWGRGVGKGLLEAVLARADGLGVDTHLETTRPSNVAPYERFGFSTVGAPVKIAGSAPTFCMRRPRAAS